MSKIKVGKDSIRIIPDTSKKTYEPVIQITKDKLMSSDEFKTFIMSDGRSDFSSMKTRKYSEKELNRILCDMGLRRESNHKTKFDDYVDDTYSVSGSHFDHDVLKEMWTDPTDVFQDATRYLYKNIPITVGTD